MATELEIAEMLTAAWETCPSFKKPETDIQVSFWHQTWYRYLCEHLGNAPIALMQKALDNARVNTSPFFQDVFEVVKAYKRLTHGGEKTALEAWAVVQRALVIHGNYHPPKGHPNVLDVPGYEWDFDDPLISQAVLGLGWAHLFEGEEDVMRSHFIRAYDAMKLRQLQHAALPMPEPRKELAP